MGYSKIIALDLGKFKTVARVMDVATRGHLAIVALARKVLILCWGMLKRQTPFRGPAMTAVALE
jgi:hypothetical protein